jgi:hypothetical protein
VYGFEAMDFLKARSISYAIDKKAYDPYFRCGAGVGKAWGGCGRQQWVGVWGVRKEEGVTKEGICVGKREAGGSTGADVAGLCCGCTWCVLSQAHNTQHWE